MIAALSELSFLSMVAEPLQVLSPISRFLGLPWLIATEFMLPTTRALPLTARRSPRWATWISEPGPSLASVELTALWFEPQQRHPNYVPAT